MPSAATTDPRVHESAFLRAARSEPVPHTPVWFMRQAGRSLPEYRRVREGVAMLESCMRPDLVVEITLQPVRRYGVDAAIFFSDIVLPLKAVGVDLDIKPGVGPVVAQPVRTLADVAAIPDLTPEHVGFVTESVQALVGELGATPLIGFAGAPFTVASYLVEGGPSKEHAKTKAMMFGAPDVWDALMRKIASISAGYLAVQVEAGASAVQLFDSWAGASLAGRLPALRDALLRPGARRGRRARRAADPLRGRHRGAARADGGGRRRRRGRRLAGAARRRRTPGGRPGRAGQPRPVAGVRADRGDARAGHRGRRGRPRGPGHIFNLGHGVLPSTDPDQLARLTDHVHTLPR